MSPKDIGSEQVFLQYVADTLVTMPESRDLNTRIDFGTQRAAYLLRTLAQELEAAGQAAQAKTFLDVARSVRALPEKTGLGLCAEARPKQ